MKHYLKFDVEIGEVKKLNETFSTAICRIFYTGLNRNGSFITKECAEKMAETIAYTPVIGEWNKEIDNFKGHGGKIVIDTDGVKYIDTTVPYGCVIDEPIWWETVTDESGNEKEYMCCKIVLWTEKYPDAMKVVNNGSYQSMEIQILESEYKDNIYYIHNATFLALCILGKDEENPDNSTIPCFEDSVIESAEFNLNTNKFKEEFNAMISQLKTFALENIKINKESEVQDMADKPVKTQEDFALSVQQIYTAIDKVLESRKILAKDWWDEPIEIQEYYSIDLIPDEKIVIVIDNATWSNYFGIPYNMNGDIAELDFDNAKPYMRGEWREVQEGANVVTSVNFSKIRESFETQLKSYSEKAVEKVKSEFNVKETEEYKLMEKELTTLKEQFSQKQENTEVVNELEILKSDYETQKNNFEQAIQELETIKQENESLKEFKLNIEKQQKIAEVDALVSEFELEEEEVKELKEKTINGEFTLDTLRKELFALEGMKIHKGKTKFSKVEDKKEDTTIKILNTNDDKSPYGSISHYFGK